MPKFAIQLLMILAAAISAFTLPEAKSWVREVAQGIFMPVAYPIRMVGQGVSARLSPVLTKDILSPAKGRSVAELTEQNAALLTTIVNLQTQIDDLKARLAQFSQLRQTLQTVVTPAGVVEGPASANRQVLTINTAQLQPIREGMAVICPLGFVGQIYTVAPANITSRVLLVTDPLSHIGVRLYRITPQPGGALVSQRVQMPPLQVDGSQTGMVISQLAARSVRNVVQPNDLVLLDDNRFPAMAQGLRIGTVKAINLPPNDSGHASITVEPVTDLMTLKDVLVVNKAAK